MASNSPDFPLRKPIATTVQIGPLPHDGKPRLGGAKR